jgi:hypothetical protein
MRYLIFSIFLVVSTLGLSAQNEEQHVQNLRFFNHSQVGFLIGEESENKVIKAMIPSFHTVNGIRIGNHFGMGVGIGIEPFEYTIYPVFASGYYFLTNKKNTPYLAVKGGYAFANSKTKAGNYYYNGEYNNKGGLMFNPEIGVRFKTAGFDMTLSGGYRYQRLESQATPDGTIYTYKHTVDYKRTSITLGIMF